MKKAESDTKDPTSPASSNSTFAVVESTPTESSTQQQSQPPLRRTPWSRTSPTIASRLSLFSILVTIALFVLVFFLSEMTLPSPTTFKPSSDLPFNHTNALSHIHRMGTKRRFVFSDALHESLTYIQSYAHSLEETAQQNNMSLDVDFFTCQPSSYTTTLSILTLRLSYSDISSVIVKLAPNGKEHLKPLLITSHVDSAVDTAGVNDELSGVGIMMELMRCLVEVSQGQLQRPVIFFFDGAEEIILQGAHGFITQHKWANNIATHINLESLGSGNEYNLFRLGPNHPWLAKAYAQSVTNPLASAVATDAFETKMIPGETDFRIFYEYGNIPGYDFIFCENGYVYHARQDDLDHLEDQGILHAGITVYQLSMHLAGLQDAIGSHLNETAQSPPPPTFIRRAARFLNRKLAKKYSRNVDDNDKFQTPAVDINQDNLRTVFFDILQTFVITYDEEIATLLGVSSMILSAVLWVLLQIRNWSKRDWKVCIKMCVMMFLAMVAGLMSSTYLAFVYNKVFKVHLIWYGSLTKAFLVFGPPLLIGILTVVSWLLPKKLPVLQYDFMLFGYCLIQWSLTFACIRNSIMSGYIPTFLLLCGSVLGTVQSEIINVPPMIRHIELISIHALLFCKVMANSLKSVLPILGRVRVGSNSEQKLISHDTVASWIVGVFLLYAVVLPCIPILSYYAGGLKKVRRVTFGFTVWTAAVLIFALPRFSNESNLKGVATPYSVDAPKRMSTVHFYLHDTTSQSSPSTSSIILLGSMDAVDIDIDRFTKGLLSTESDSSNFKSLIEAPIYFNNAEDDDKLITMSVLESVLPFKGMLQHTHVFETNNRPSLPVPVVDIVDDTYLPDIQKYNLSISIHGCQECNTITFRARSSDSASGVIKQWSLDCPLEDKSGYVWVKHHGKSDLKLWMVVDALKHDDGNFKRETVALVVSNAHAGLSNHSQELIIINDNLESWEAPTNFISVASQFLL